MKIKGERSALAFFFATVIIFILVVWVFLLKTIADIQSFEAETGRVLEEFKEISDGAWNSMLTPPIYTDKETLRLKRYISHTATGYAVYQPESGGFTVSGTSATCNCCPNEAREAGGVNEKCPAGPRGNPGTKGICGEPGLDGSDGRSGLDGNQLRYGDMKECVICPTGPPGFPGQDGLPGLSGPPGAPGITGYPGRQGKEGTVGEPGSQGYSGEPGYPGSPGNQGESTIREIGAPGTRGTPGRQGDMGTPGFPGRSASAGLRGAPGRPGIPGSRGLDGRPGTPERSGPPGYPGEDASYCQCPTRSQEVMGGGASGRYSAGDQYTWKKILKRKKKLLAGKI